MEPKETFDDYLFNKYYTRLKLKNKLRRAYQCFKWIAMCCTTVALILPFFSYHENREYFSGLFYGCELSSMEIHPQWRCSTYLVASYKKYLKFNKRDIMEILRLLSTISLATASVICTAAIFKKTVWPLGYLFALCSVVLTIVWSSFEIDVAINGVNRSKNNDFWLIHAIALITMSILYNVSIYILYITRDSK